MVVPPRAPSTRQRQTLKAGIAALVALTLVIAGATIPTVTAAQAASPSYQLDVTHGLGAGEPELAIDPVHKTLVISFLYSNPPGGGSNQGCGVAVSGDDGSSWRVRLTHPADPGPTPGDPYHQCSDPTAAAGPGGVVYVGAGWWDTPGGAIDYYNMYVSRSSDGGLTWGASAFATGDRQIANNVALGGNTGHSDREFLAVDNRTGTLYVSATDFPRLRRWVVASHDEGLTFGPLHPIDSTDYPMNDPAAEGQGTTGPVDTISDSVPAAANGLLAFSYVAAPVAGVNSCPCNVFETSSDDGATWMRHLAPIAANSTTADPSHPGRFAIMSGGGIVAARASDRLYVSMTSDYGRSWSRPVKIGQNPPNARYQPWINYSPTGVLGVGYKTQYSDGSFDFWADISYDGGLTFGAPIRVSHARSPAEPFGGDDFSYVALDKRYLYATWADLRTGVRSVYFARVPLHAGSCPAASGEVHGRSVGALRLGQTRAHARAQLKRFRITNYGFDDFCLAGGLGIRVGYPRAKLLRSLPRAQRAGVARRIVIALTANPYYSVSGVRPGASLAFAQRRLKLGATEHLGRNYWYFAPGRAASVLLKVRHGVVLEIGLADKQLTSTRKLQLRLLLSYPSV